ncbi:Beta-xylosidase [Mucilaginibacter gossypiicola]|uniref:Beta-xylosidase n=1 Tax=Mucilaginibacter gossypiicola TaxID=551995 RepID=A0A1H8P6S8_9SPHI|nr:family 43 glycosylhydrolase [Mucilaginibacter gossypiicola]SEO37576.1 Beta-xylosidase [Mucilaginibacter gossypiicola]
MHQSIRLTGFIAVFALRCLFVNAQAKMPDSSSFYQTVNTYVNPVLPGDHPDPTLLKVGDDFYYCGSSFHFNPYLPVYHSKDLVHWEVISRVLPSSKAGWVADKPSAGIWQGAITYFYGSYWIYFSAGGQWFCKAGSPKGPWSAPVQVKTNPETGNLGYDNSVFVDDDGKPYMVIKNGQKVNRLQALGKDGQLTDHVINLDWVNARLQYSWAEGPVMCKRNGYYYYFPAGDVSGGQYVLRGTELTGDSTKWERLGDFFKPITDNKAGFRRPNHISAPLQLADGTWWTIGQSYEKYEGDDWSGTGRQTSLYPVIWEGDRPWGMAPTSLPIPKPNLQRGEISWRSVRTDYFDGKELSLSWHFLTKKASASYSLTNRKGWIRLTPDSTRTHLVQKETDHYYSAVTKVDLLATDERAKAGIYLTNGNQAIVVKLYSGYRNGKKIFFSMDTATRVAPNTIGNVVWLKLERYGHELSGYYSGDGKTWLSLGRPINAANLDKAQPNFNSWVGTSVGLFAEGKPADFDCFICKDGASSLPAAGYSNYYGMTAAQAGKLKTVTNTSKYGGWFMISGVEIGAHSPSAVQIVASSKSKGVLQIWLDDLRDGKLIATIPVNTTGAYNYKTFSKQLKNVTGQHDVFVRYPAGNPQSIFIKSIRFASK